MKKSLMVIVVMNFVYCFGFGQAGNWVWARQGAGNAIEEGIASATDASGNVYAIGIFADSAMVLGSYTLTNSGGYDIFIVKYSSTGSVLWTHRAGGANNEYVNSITVDGTGDVYITGEFTGPTITFGTNTLTNSGNGKMFIVKYSSTGTVLWAQTPGGNSFCWGNSVTTDISGNVLVTGCFNTNPIIFGSTTLINVNNNTNDFFIVKYSSSGTVIWAKREGGNGDDQGISIGTDVSGNVYVSGKYYSSTLVFGIDTLINSGGFDIFIVKYSSLGNLLWSHRAGGAINDLCRSMAIDAVGNIYIVGSFNSPSIMFGLDTLVNTGISAMFIVEYNTNGSVVVAKSALGINNVSAWSVTTVPTTTSNSFIYVTGGFTSPTIIFDSDTLIYPLGSTDPMFIVKYDPNLNVICATFLPSGGDDVSGVSTDNFGNAYIVGDFQRNPFIVGSFILTQTATENFFIAKYNCNVTTVGTDDLSNSETIFIYPNPTEGKFIIESSNYKIENIKIVNVLGEEVNGKWIVDNGQCTIDMSSEGKGIYFAEIKTLTEIVNKKIIVQ